jgi:hypothetical protein
VKRAYSVLLCLLLVAFVRTARAQRTEITSSVDTDVVELGESVTYTQQAMVHGGGTPTSPKPGPLPGFSIRAVSSSPVRMHTNVNGILDEMNGLVTTWTLKADRVGAFPLGPSQITANGVRRTAPNAVQVRVVPRGQAPRNPRGGRAPVVIDPFGMNPLDPFKGLFDFGDDDNRRAETAAAQNANAKLALDAPRGQVAFLHATVDKSQAIVGEQITLAVYLYEDPYTRQGRPNDVHEPTANEFLKRTLLEDDALGTSAGTALVGGRVWNVKLVRKSALFPLKTGRLPIEPMTITLPQSLGPRAAERLFVDVREPPLAGRPPGYAIGDVGEMSLQATVTPRAIPRDGAIGVTLELRGTGNLPYTLTVPTVPGVEWLEPQVREKLGALQNDTFGGTRSLSYVVRVHNEGAVDLGEIKLPYFDPAKNAYAVARATLGIVNVAAGTVPARDAGADEPEKVLADLPPARSQLEGHVETAYLSERTTFWYALFGSPFACALALVMGGWLRRLRERRAVASPTPDRVAKQRIAEANAACGAEDGGEAMGAVARAIDAAVLARTGINLKGATASTSREELVSTGVSEGTAGVLLDLVRSCEAARFSPAGVSINAARETWARAKDVLERLPHKGAKA